MKIPALIGLLLLATISAQSQIIDSTIARYAIDFGQERIYLQYDKTAYAPGDTIWFKAYLMNGVTPAHDGKTIYIDWTDERGNLLQHSVSPVIEATSHGQWTVPLGYTGRYIHVKAYTKWMLNFDAEFLYNKDLPVITKAPDMNPAKQGAISNLEFFPEGGDLIETIRTKVAFKANDQWGRPIAVSGAIENDKGEILQSLDIQHDGMGYFFLTPRAGESYYAKWKDERGMDHTTNLPRVKADGASLQVVVAGVKRYFTITADSSMARDNATVYVIGTLNQYQVFKISNKFSEGIVKGIIPTQGLPSGILTITVFDEQWKPLAERITYVNNDEFRFKANLSIEQRGLSKREKNEIVLTVPDSLTASFAVSVTDGGIGTDSSENIISHLLLSSDLKGYVHNPAYYFSENSDLTAQRLDLVMLTHGWRRFNWEAIAKNKFPDILYPKDTAYLSLAGKVHGVSPERLEGKYITLILSPKGNPEGNNMAFLEILPDGSFYDPEYFIFDTTEIFHQLPKKVGDPTVTFMQNRLAPVSTTAANNFFVGALTDTTGYARQVQLSDEILQLLMKGEGKVLENVVVKAKTKSQLELMDEKYSSGLFGGDAYKFDLVNDKTAFPARNIFQYLQGRVAGLLINANQNPPFLEWRGDPVQLFVDEMPVDPQIVASMSVSQLAFIKVFRPPFFGNSGGGSTGAIAIYTRKGGDAEALAKGLNKNVVMGYTPVREFYSPDYSKSNESNSTKDLRTTLYWNPQVNTTSSENKIMLSFYNNDISRSLRVVIEGMTKDGQLVRIEQLIE